MTTIDAKLDEKQDMVEGVMTQAKEVVREQWDHISDNDLARLAGKKDEMVGRLQAKYGNRWVMRHGRLVLFVTIVSIICTALALFISRNQRHSPV